MGLSMEISQWLPSCIFTYKFSNMSCFEYMSKSYIKKVHVEHVEDTTSRKYSKQQKKKFWVFL